MPSSACEPSPSLPMYMPGRRRMCSRGERVTMASSPYAVLLFSMSDIGIIFRYCGFHRAPPPSRRAPRPPGRGSAAAMRSRVTGGSTCSVMVLRQRKSLLGRMSDAVPSSTTGRISAPPRGPG